MEQLKGECKDLDSRVKRMRIKLLSRFRGLGRGVTLRPHALTTPEFRKRPVQSMAFVNFGRYACAALVLGVYAQVSSGLPLEDAYRAPR